MAEITEILERLGAGHSAAANELLPLVYEELRVLARARMAAERPDHTLQSTALVHEAYVRLLGSSGGQSWDSRGHFFAAAAEAMRRILVDSARARASRKRGGDRCRVDLTDFADQDLCSPDLVLDLDEGLSRLGAEDPESAELVKMRLFAGLSITEAGKTLGMGRSTAYENWEYARSWFAVYLNPESP